MRQSNKLSAKRIEAAPHKKTDYKIFDGEGLYLFVTRAGGKFWRMKYRKNDGKEDTLTFGSYPEVSLRKARELKAEARRKLALGIDPKEE